LVAPNDAGMIGVITAIATGTLALFIGATIVAGASQGNAISAATRGLLHGSTGRPGTDLQRHLPHLPVHRHDRR
jgi:hypothetical protein